MGIIRNVGRPSQGLSGLGCNWSDTPSAARREELSCPDSPGDGAVVFFVAEPGLDVGHGVSGVGARIEGREVPGLLVVDPESRRGNPGGCRRGGTQDTQCCEGRECCRGRPAPRPSLVARSAAAAAGGAVVVGVGVVAIRVTELPSHV